MQCHFNNRRDCLWLTPELLSLFERLEAAVERTAATGGALRLWARQASLHGLVELCEHIRLLRLELEPLSGAMCKGCALPFTELEKALRNLLKDDEETEAASVGPLMGSPSDGSRTQDNPTGLGRLMDSIADHLGISEGGLAGLSKAVYQFAAFIWEGRYNVLDERHPSCVCFPVYLPRFASTHPYYLVDNCN